MSKKLSDLKKLTNRAIYTAIWVGKPVKVCENHARQIVSVGEAMGVSVPLVVYIGDECCSNCKNEEKR